MKKIFTLAALAIAISASASAKETWPTTGLYPYPVIEGDLLKLPAEPKLPALPTWPTWPTEPVACRLGN